MKLAKAMGLVVSDHRKARGWNQTELGAKLGWSQRKVSEMESGRQPPHLDEIEAIANALGKKTLELVKEALERSGRSISE
jgi:transcriptional regulator with XRE-family HTH domain